MQVHYLQIRSMLQVQSLQKRSTPQVPSQMSVGAGRKSKANFLAVAHFLPHFPAKHRLKCRVYRQLVPLNLWTKLWHFWGHTKVGFEVFCFLKTYNNLGGPAAYFSFSVTVHVAYSLFAGTVPA